MFHRVQQGLKGRRSALPLKQDSGFDNSNSTLPSELDFMSLTDLDLRESRAVAPERKFSSLDRFFDRRHDKERSGEIADPAPASPRRKLKKSIIVTGNPQSEATARSHKSGQATARSSTHKRRVKVLVPADIYILHSSDNHAVSNSRKAQDAHNNKAANTSAQECARARDETASEAFTDLGASTCWQSHVSSIPAIKPSRLDCNTRSRRPRKNKPSQPLHNFVVRPQRRRFVHRRSSSETISS
jgi:hypothetical protein